MLTRQEKRPVGYETFEKNPVGHIVPLPVDLAFIIFFESESFIKLGNATSVKFLLTQENFRDIFKHFNYDVFMDICMILQNIGEVSSKVTF